MKKLLTLITLILLTTFYLYPDLMPELPNLTGNTIIQETPEITVYFCPRHNCSYYLTEALKQAQERIHCALYDMNLPEVKNTLFEMEKKVDVLLIMDDDYVGNLNKYYWIRDDQRQRLMHNKFCIIDNHYVWTGSFNPTYRGNTMNNNNALLIKSKNLNNNYEEEFKEMWYGNFGKGNPVTTPTFSYLENYFCPEDKCSQHVLETLNQAKESIYFMTFSFTDDNIGNLLIDKHKRGITVKGIFEKTQNNAYNEHEKLKQNNIQVQWDNNSANMHHKVFIVDEKTVITGSYNPSKNGDKYNDENILIIHNEQIAKQYVEEFNLIWPK